MKCHCGKPIVYDNLCRIHWIEKQEEIYLDNSDINDMGIFKWASYMLAEYTPNSTPDIHRKMISLLLSFYDPFYINKIERQANIISYRGSSKGQPLDSKVLTPSGWKTIGELKVGDTLYGSQGKPIKVTHLHPITEMDIYEVETRDGRKTRCDEDHLWTVEDWCSHKGHFVTRPIKELAKVYKYPHRDKRDGKIQTDYRFYLHTSKPIVFAKKDLPVDPYVLGLWLGDGHSADTRITGEKNDLEFYRSELDKIGYFYSDLMPNKGAKSKRIFTMNVSFSEIKKGTRKSMQSKFREMNLLNNKHIPQEYLYSSIEDRVALLQGLVDTDGCVVKQGGHFSYSTISDQLKDGFVFLVRSLGGTCTIRKKIVKLNGKEYGHWYISSRVPKEIIPVRLPRKLIRWKGSARTFAAITRIEKTEKALRRCISVDAPDGLYITDDFMLTHNSTLLNTILVLYLICHNGKMMKIKSASGDIIEVLINEKFITIISETGGSAEQFVVRARNELTSNRKLKYFYHYDLIDAREDDTGKWTQKAFKYNGCLVLGVGSGQQIRGRVEGAYRVSFMIFDDIYSENNTITPESRTKIKTWFNNAALNSVDDLIGKVLIVNTIVHEDTIPVQLKNARNWKTLQFSVMPLEKFKKFIKEHLYINEVRGICKLPFEDESDAIGEFEVKRKQRAYFKKVQESYDWELSWGDRIDLYYLALKYQEALQKRQMSSLYQEYFHVIVSEEQKQIKPEYFRVEQMDIEYKYGYTWLNCNLFQTPQPVNIEIGLDFASGSSDGDDAVAIVAGILPNSMKVVLEMVSGKMSKRDQIKGATASNYGSVEFDRDKIQRTGLIDEAIRLAVKYKAKRIKVGYAGTEKSNVEEVRRLVYLNKLYDCMVIGRKQDQSEGAKRERILNNLSSEYETRNVLHNPGLDKLEYQLEFLKNTDLDDCADCLEVAMWQMQKPFEMDLGFYQTNQIKNKVRFKKLQVQLPSFDWRKN